MSFEILSPGFERDGFWILQDNAEISTERKRTGARSLRLWVGTAVVTDSRALSNVVKLRPGEETPFRFYVNFDDVDTVPSGASELVLGYRPESGGDDVEILTLDRSDKGDLGEWIEFSGTFVPAPGVTRARMFWWGKYANPPGGLWEDVYFVDDVSVGDTVWRKYLRDQLFLDLRDIDGTGIFTTDLTAGFISEEGGHDLATVASPAAFLIPGTGGNTDLDTMGQVDGAGTIYFRLQLLIRSAAFHGDALVLLDDVSNAVERKTGNLQTANQGNHRVMYAGVADHTEVYTSEDLDEQTGMIQALVRANYHFRFGEL